MASREYGSPRPSKRQQTSPWLSGEECLRAKPFMTSILATGGCGLAAMRFARSYFDSPGPNKNVLRIRR